MVSEDISGKDVENGITVKEYVEINGHRQGMMIKGDDTNSPVLLFLHGGPGFPAYPMIKKAGLKLERYFTVCYWNQRGTGMSYNNEIAKAR